MRDETDIERHHDTVLVRVCSPLAMHRDALAHALRRDRRLRLEMVADVGHCAVTPSVPTVVLLDAEAAELAEGAARASRVIRYKSAKYTIEQPLLVGALAGGVDPAAVPGLSAYGLALGEAFQLRDDLLGVFGDPEQTGKPAGDDVREGKRTVLVAYTLDVADRAQTTELARWFGRPAVDAAGIDSVRQIIRAVGAVDRVESDISRLTHEATQALGGSAAYLRPEASTVLSELVQLATDRVT